MRRCSMSFIKSILTRRMFRRISASATGTVPAGYISKRRKFLLLSLIDTLPWECYISHLCQLAFKHPAHGCVGERTLLYKRFYAAILLFTIVQEWPITRYVCTVLDLFVVHVCMSECVSVCVCMCVCVGERESRVMKNCL